MLLNNNALEHSSESGQFLPTLFIWSIVSDATEHIQHILAPILLSLGLTLWDLEFKKEGPKWLLRVYIERDNGGVTIDDCEAVSRDLGAVLDIEDCISHSYTLEVSSPGLDRALRHEEHYRRSIGKLLKIKLFSPVDGEKLFTGTIKGVMEGTVTIETSTGLVKAFPLPEIAAARLVVVV